MTDDRFDKDLRDALDRLMAERAPADLRIRVGRVLAQPAIDPRPARWRGVRLAGGLALAGTLALGVLAVVMWPRPSGVATPSGSAGMPSPIASSSPASSWPAELGMPVVTVPSASVRQTTVQDLMAERAGSAPAGPFAYLVGSGDTSIRVVDIGGGSVRTSASPTHADERVIAVLHDDRWLVIETATPLDACQPPVATRAGWRILAASLGSDGMPGAFDVVDSGVASWPFLLPGSFGMDCAHPVPPPLALNAGIVAYAIDETGGAGPATTVVIRPLDLPPGSCCQTLTASRQVVQLALSPTAVAWVESANGLKPDDVPDWRVVEGTLADGATAAVPVGETAGKAHEELPFIVLDGTAVLASLDQYEASSGTVVRVDGGRIETVDPGHANRSCGAVWGGGGVAVLVCSGILPDPGSSPMDQQWLATWSAEAGLRAVAAGSRLVSPMASWVAADWLVWDGVGKMPDGTDGTSYSALSLRALAAAMP
jgi:hypothetical protein